MLTVKRQLIIMRRFTISSSKQIEGEKSMDFRFSEEQKKFRQEVRDFLEEEIRQGLWHPSCDAWVHGFSPEFTRRVAQMDWIGASKK